MYNFEKKRNLLSLIILILDKVVSSGGMNSWKNPDLYETKVVGFCDSKYVGEIVLLGPVF